MAKTASAPKSDSRSTASELSTADYLTVQLALLRCSIAISVASGDDEKGRPGAATLGRDAETQDALVCFGTKDSGTFSFRLSGGLVHELNESITSIGDEAPSNNPDEVSLEAAEAEN
jgi:hypothetical protein